MTNRENDLPNTDLSRLKAEVLDAPAEAALPCNLSDEWLTFVARDLMETLENDTESCDKRMAAPLALITKILIEKNGSSELKIPLEMLFKYFGDYQIEIALEQVRRATDIKPEPASLESIFTDRDVEMLR